MKTAVISCDGSGKKAKSCGYVLQDVPNKTNHLAPSERRDCACSECRTWVQASSGKRLPYSTSTANGWVDEEREE